ncbi:MAG: aminopeptidase P family protein [Spirochaetia bacterium]
MSIENRIEKFRLLLQERGLHGYIINGTDPHQSEYPPERWRTRAWISGFTGSAGTVVVTRTAAGLWTDSRYHLAAEKQIQDTGINLYRSGNQGVPGYDDWLLENCSSGQKIGFDGASFSVAQYRSLSEKLNEKDITVEAGEDLIGEIWDDRPPLPGGDAFLMATEYTGRERSEKINDVRAFMNRKDAQVYITADLPGIAWLLNLRGTDVAYNPLLLAYAAVLPDEVILFTDAAKFSPGDVEILEGDGVFIQPYEAMEKFAASLKKGTAVYFSPGSLSMNLYRLIPEGCVKKEGNDPVTDLKAVKTKTEIEGIKRCMIREGVALTKFFHWFYKAVPEGNVTELSAQAKLKEIRSAGENYRGESFEAISAFGEHGAIVHYAPDAESDGAVKGTGIYLLDSGAHYMDGTTDITRTVAVGKAGAKQKRDYTLVLKGHIALSEAVFPQGTSGNQLDILARQHLWNSRMNYGHGTGHGVGHYLNVHEGPQGISPKNGTPLKPGMVTSNEPGLYPGSYGIRIENLILTVEDKKTEYGQFYRFETLTLFPYDRNLIDTALLSGSELDRINGYHKEVYRALSPHLKGAELELLKEMTRELK